MTVQCELECSCATCALGMNERKMSRDLIYLYSTFVVWCIINLLLSATSLRGTRFGEGGWHVEDVTQSDRVPAKLSDRERVRERAIRCGCKCVWSGKDGRFSDAILDTMAPDWTATVAMYWYSASVSMLSWGMQQIRVLFCLFFSSRLKCGKTCAQPRPTL